MRPDSESPSPSFTEISTPATAQEPRPTPNPTPEGRTGATAARRGEPIVVFLIAFALGLPLLEQVPFTDELNHVLAARSLLSNATLELLPGSGPYARGSGMTYLVAGMFRVFGDSLTTGRLPSLAFGALLVTVLFLWVRSQVGRAGAWFSAMLLAFLPIGLELSLWVRAYTLYALLIFAACVLAYRAMSPAPLAWPWRAALAVTTLLVLVAVEPLTGTGTVFIATGGLGLWVLLIGVPEVFRRLPSRRARLMLAAIFSALAIATIAAAFLSGFMNRLWVDGTRADLWAEADRHNLRYYHDRLLRQYPLLWPLFPLAAWIAIARHRRAGLLALCVFAVPLLAHSIVAAKAERYLYYAMPMFFALYGIAIGTALPSVRGWLASLVPSGRTAFIRAFDLGAGLVLAMIVAYPLLLRPGLLFAVREIRQGDAPWVGWGRPSGNPDWLAAGDSLRHLLDVSEVVLGSDEVAAYYGLGRIDYLVRRAATPERGVLPEFTPYRRVVPIVTTPQSLGRIAECGSTGLLFVERKYTNREWTGIPPLLPYLEANFIRVPVPEPWALLVYRWEHTASPSSLVDDVDGAGCDGLPHRQNRPGRER